MDAADKNSKNLSPHVRTYIEKNFYHDLNSTADWDKIFVNSLTNNEDLFTNIENFANNGISNLRTLAQLTAEYFELSYKIIIEDDLPKQLPAMKWYAILICYFYNCYDASNSKYLYELTQEQQIEFFYRDELLPIFELILQEHKTELEKIKKELDLDKMINFSFIVLLRELLIFPFVLNLKTMKANDNLDCKDFVQSYTRPFLAKFYNNFDTDSFVWLKESHEAGHFQSDLFNTIVIFKFIKSIYFLDGSKKLYGSYQRLIDKQTANVLYSIPYQSYSFLLKGTSAIYAGQANIDKIEVLANKFILINFRLGVFFDEAVTSQAAFNTAMAINEFLSSVNYIFSHKFSHKTKDSISIQLLLETPYDNPHFAELVKEQLHYLSPDCDNVIKEIPAVRVASLSEKYHYVSTPTIEYNEKFSQEIAKNIKSIIPITLSEYAFTNVKLIELNAGDKLFEEGDFSAFVYIPLGEGLEGQSKRGQIQFHPKPGIPIGHIGVIQGNERTATIIAKTKVKLLMIPGITYLRFWHADYTVDEIREKIMKGLV